MEVILVEDNPLDIELSLEAFRQVGDVEHEVKVFQNGEDVLKYLFHELNPQPKVILLDLFLPGLSGMEVLKRLKSHKLTRFLPVLMFSAAVDDTHIQHAYETGANGFVRKPLQIHVLNNYLRTIRQFWLKLNKLPGVAPA